MSGSSGIRRRPWDHALSRHADDALPAAEEQEVAPSLSTTRPKPQFFGGPGSASAPPLTPEPNAGDEIFFPLVCGGLP